MRSGAGPRGGRIRVGAGVAEVFISYAQATLKEAEQVAAALRALGHQVWRDDQLPAHRAYADVIEERLRLADAVVVVWSAAAAKSQWVRAEADVARESGKLVQLTVDGALPPMPFNQIQCVNLSGWTGDTRNHAWQIVLASLAELGRPLPAPGAWNSPAFAAPEPSSPLLAVLPFDNLSGDSEMNYFSDGVSEEIQQAVVRGAGLKVIGRTSSFQFRGADKDVARVAAELKATHVLDGSVRRSGQRVRVTAQVVECASQTTLWSERFDRDLSDIFALQDEIAEAVAMALKSAFAAPAPVGKIDPTAYDLYLHVRNDLGWGDQSNLGLVEMLEKVVALAPSLAPAWATLACALVIRLRRFSEPNQRAQLRARVEAAAEAALRLDSNSGLAYVAKAYLHPWGRYADQEKLLTEAVALSPCDPFILQEMVSFSGGVGRMNEALGFATRALALDPLYQEAAFGLAMSLHFVGRYGDAMAALKDFAARWPQRDFSVMAMFWAAARHDWDRFDALLSAASESELFVDARTQAIRVGEILRRPTERYREEQRALIRSQLGKTGAIGYGDLSFACQIGLIEDVFAAIDQATFPHLFDELGGMPSGLYSPTLIFDPLLNDIMIQDIRFVSFCNKIGLVDYWMQTDRWPDCADTVSYDFRAESRRLGGR